MRMPVFMGWKNNEHSTSNVGAVSALDVRCWMFHLVIAHAPDTSSYKPNAFPPSDEGKAEVRVNRKSIMAIGIMPLLFDSYHE